MISPANYHLVFLIIVMILTILGAITIFPLGADRLLKRKGNGFIVSLLITLFFVLFLGLRPISGFFVDTMTYYQIYNDFQNGIQANAFFENDRLFGYIMYICAKGGLSVNLFFLIIEALYLLPVLWACKRLSGNNTDLMMLFVLGAFSFFAYGVNGIRNGMALSFVMLALTFIQGGPKERILFVMFSLFSIFCHFSCLLPVVCVIAASLIRKPHFFFVFWLLSIAVSLLIGDVVSNFFASLGFDDRLAYLNAEVDEEKFSRTGFRWDFVLYSMMPIVLGWYVLYKKHIYNRPYLILLGTYILANAFWIMIITAEYSNRFAYLSWFLYPIVLAYPLVKFPVWKRNQGQNVTMIMLAHFTFTFAMFMIGK